MNFHPGQTITLSGAYYRLDQLLATTASSQVWAASEPLTSPPKRLAVKIFDHLCTEHLHLQSLRRITEEITFYHSLPDCLRGLFIPFYNHGYFDDCYACVMARMDTNLCGVTFDEERPRRLAKLWLEVALALHCLHRNGYLHLDIKPGNILCNYDLQRFYLSDFGTLQAIDAPLAGASPGTRGWIPPELYYGTEHAPSLNRATDIYAFGLLLFTLISEQLPETHTRPGSRLLGSDDLGVLTQGLLRLELSGENRLQLGSTIIRCLRPAPEERPASLAELLPLLCSINQELRPGTSKD